MLTAYECGALDTLEAAAIGRRNAGLCIVRRTHGV
jgi:hypothetical protein